jgi:hypothetical protein
MEKMKTTLSHEITTAVAKMVEEMENKDILEIPNASGLMLVRIDSAAYKEKEKDPSIMFYEVSDTFCVTSK